MKFIIGSRGSGVTTDVILEASQFDRPIIVPNEIYKRHIKDECVRLNISCPDIYTFTQIKAGIFKGQRTEIIYIADVNTFHKFILTDYGFNGKIGTVCASLEFEG